MIPTLEWLSEGVSFLDQTKLPHEETYVLATDYKQVATVIRDMIVRGAMAIGVSGAMGVALGILRSEATTLPELTAEVETICHTLASTRPTAVNLFWAIGADEPRSTVQHSGIFHMSKCVDCRLIRRSRNWWRGRVRYTTRTLQTTGELGRNWCPESLPDHKGTVLTHCNAGALATCRLRHRRWA